MAGALATDLIAAVATPPGQGGIGVVRLSGPDAKRVARQLTGIDFKPRYAHFARFRSAHNDDFIDEGLVLWFPGTASFTGEEVVELQCHGSPVVMQMLLDEVCALGARLARPGEFSERAFLNGKLDLAQAEAIADLIASTSSAAARAAVRSLRGEFSSRVGEQAEQLTHLRVFVEACIDFPDEDVEFLHHAQIAEQLQALLGKLRQLRSDSHQGLLLSQGIAVALVGAPNAGKSSLLNALSGEEAAIVTDIPGTTRDLLKVDLSLDGLAIRLVDTAGLRDSTDTVERIGVARAREQAEQADLVLVIMDAALVARDRVESELKQLLAGIAYDPARILLVLNKVDLPAAAQIAMDIPPSGYPVCPVSALTGAGIPELRQQILHMIGVQPAETQFTARARHIEAIDLALAALQRAEQLLRSGDSTELVAEELWAAHAALGEIVGTITPDDLLGRIFSEFCIGK